MTELGTGLTITTERFVMRPLTPEDATPRYLAWLREETALRYIQSAKGTLTLADLRQYIAERAHRDDVLFLGIFERATGGHIGNIKYEPIDEREGTAEVGILIGDASSRGRGAAAEIIRATARWLRQHRGVSRIRLGVERSNGRALTAYRRAGFAPATPGTEPHERPDIIRMELDAGSLV